MKILLATDVFPPKSGGSGWSTFHLARALVQRGHTVEVAQPKAGIRGTQTREYEGLRVVEVGYAASNLPGLRAWQRDRAMEQTMGAYLAERGRAFDVIHAQHVLTILAASAAKKISGVPFVSTVRDYWAVCLYGTLWRDEAICPICHGTEITRCLAQKYGGAAKFMEPVVPFVERELKRRQRALQASDAVIAVSHFVAQTLVGQHNISVVPNLIDLAETRAIADHQPPSGGRYLLFVGKLNGLKGADLLPQILEKSGVNLPLLVAGDGALRAKLADFQGISVRGWLPNTETLGLMAGAHALLFPSRWAEPLARTLLEAQALGIPTVAWNSGGTRDIIEDDFNGLLADSVDEFAAKLGRLVGDDALRARLSENSTRVAKDKFSPEAVVTQLEEIYANCVVGRLQVNYT